MKRNLLLVALTALVAAGLFTTTASAQTFDEALAAIKTYELGQSRLPLTFVHNYILAAKDAPAQQRTMAGKMTAMLDSDATYQAKQFLCRELAIIGGPDNVPGIAALLYDPETADMARYALHSIPGDATDKALLKALPEVDDATRVSIINTLGVRQAEAAVKTLKDYIDNPNTEIAAAAIDALGKIGSKKAGRALQKAKSNVPEELDSAVTDALLLLADQYMAQENRKSAIQVYNMLYAEGEPEQVRVAAFVGLVLAEEQENAKALIEEAKSGSDAAISTAAQGLDTELYED